MVVRLDGRGFDEKAIIFGVDNSSSVHAYNKKKDILGLGKGRTKWPTLRWKQKLFVNWVKIYQFEAKDSEIKS